MKMHSTDYSQQDPQFPMTKPAEKAKAVSFRNLFSVVLVLLTAAAWNAQALGAQTNSNQGKGKAVVNSEWERVREALRHAKPMPSPSAAAPSKLVTPAKGMAQFNPKTKRVVQVPSADQLGRHPAGQKREGAIRGRNHAPQKALRKMFTAHPTRASAIWAL